MEGIPFYYRMIRGAIGKDRVIKHYKRGNKMGKIVVTRFPDMSGIVATEKQRVRRDLFREAVVFAKWVIADGGRKLAFKSTLPRKKRRKVYQVALQLYMSEKGNKQWVSKQWAICNGQLANIENQGVLCFVDVRKQLAEKAVVESGKREILNVKVFFGQMGPWRVMWQKRKVVVDVLAQEADVRCLGLLRT